MAKKPKSVTKESAGSKGAGKATKKRKEAGSGKFVFPEAPKPFGEFLKARPRLIKPRRRGRKPGPVSGDVTEQLCELLEDAANDLVAKQCAEKEFGLESLFQPCKGQSGGGAAALDLVVVIDTSGSMTNEAIDLSNAADTAIAAAQARCTGDLQVTWLGIEDTFAGTKFDKSVRDYLHNLGVTDAQMKGRRKADIGMDAQEDGAAAIEDITDHFDWRPNVGRAIFFLGDEPLKGGVPQDDEDKQAADDAIATANAGQVTVSTYAGTGIETIPPSPSGVAAIDEFERVALATGGGFYSSAAGNVDEFRQVLENVICSSSGGFCVDVRVPEIRPCFNLRWGDGPNDRIETDDVEVICLTASNPYTNVTLKDLKAYLIVVGPSGLPAKLPDGSPSVEIRPSFVICFGDLEPCGDKDNNSRVSRDVVLISRGAEEGPYFVLVAYCYSAEFHLAHGSIFQLDLVKS